MKIIESFKYTKEHEWIDVREDIGIIGISDFAQSELGDIVFVELPNIGDSFTRNDVFGTVEAVKTVEDLYTPVTGEVVEVNESLESEAEQVNKDPYGSGWMVRIRCSDQTELADLLSSKEYAEFISGA